MEQWSAWAYSVVVCAISCGIVLQIVSDSKGKELLRLMSGILLSLTMLRPLTRINLQDFLNVSRENWPGAEPYIAEGEKIAAQTQSDSIKKACETYILIKARDMGAEIEAAVSLTEAGVPDFAELTGQVDPGIQQQLQRVLTKDLGIPKENQKWTWKQESNTS